MFNKMIVFLNEDDVCRSDKVFVNGRAENSKYKVFWYFKNATMIMPSLCEANIENDVYKDYELIVMNTRLYERMSVVMQFLDESDKTYTKEQMMKVIMPVGRQAPYNPIIDFDFPQLNNITKVDKDHIILYCYYIYHYVKNIKCIKIPKDFIGSSLKVELNRDELILNLSQQRNGNISLNVAFHLLNLGNELDLSDYDNVMKALLFEASKENYNKYYLSRI